MDTQVCMESARNSPMNAFNMEDGSADVNTENRGQSNAEELKQN